MLFSENSVEVLKELFTSCAGLNFARIVGLFGFIYKVSYIFCLMELHICLWTVSLDLSHRLSACRRSRFSSQNCSAILLNLCGLCNGREGRACQGQNRDGYCSHC